MKVITRFAPSPTGHLHIGGARTAIFCWLLARHYGGKFLLRIEDTDQERSKQEYTDSILASMNWLGMDWDGDIVYQSQRFAAHNAYVDQLLAAGQAYWCSCTTEEVEAMREHARAQGLKPRYNGKCREKNIGAGVGHCVRLKSPLIGSVQWDDLVKGNISIDMNELDDMVLRRADGTPTYNMAVVADDYDMGISHVLRGDDHVSNTPKQICLYQALGFPLPFFGHVPMILGADRQKLSKRHGAKAVVEYQKDGLLPEALINYLVRLGWSHGDQEIFSLQELIQFFDGTSLNTAPAGFDPEKLQWINGQHLRALTPEQLLPLVLPFLPDAVANSAQETLIQLISLYQSRVTSLLELAESMQSLLVPATDVTYDAAALTKALHDEAKIHVKQFVESIELTDFSSRDALHTALQGYVATNNIKFKLIGPALRVSLVGSLSGPDLPDIMHILGMQGMQERISRALSL